MFANYAVTALAYNNNVLSIKDLSQNVGQKIDDGVDWLKKKTDDIGNGMKHVGSVIDDKWNSVLRREVFLSQ